MDDQQPRPWLGHLEHGPVGLGPALPREGLRLSSWSDARAQVRAGQPSSRAAQQSPPQAPATWAVSACPLACDLGQVLEPL